MGNVSQKCAYTYLARGVTGNPSLRAYTSTTGTFAGQFPNPAVTLEVIDRMQIVRSWTSRTDFHNWCASQVAETICIPVTKPECTGAPPAYAANTLDKIVIKGDGGTMCYISGVDSNGNSVYSVNPIAHNECVRSVTLNSKYDNWCIQHSPDPLEPDVEMGVALYLWGDPYGNNVYFRLAGEIADEHYQTNPSLSAFKYAAGVSGQNIDGTFYEWLLAGLYEDPEGIAPQGTTGGGGGLYDLPDESFSIPSLPSVSVCDTGMVSLYNVTTANLQALGNYLWTSSFVENIKKAFQNPFDNIISLQVVPYAPAGTASNIIIGNIDTGVTGGKLATSYYEVNCGTVDVGEYGKMFADYAPYTKLHLYLPFCQIVELNTDDVMDGKINVVYHIDVFSGACIAFVRTQRRDGNWHIVGQYAGNISAQIPITGANFASVYIGAMNSLASIGMGVASGGMGVIAGGIAGATNAANIKPTYQRSGGVSGTAGFMSVQKPFIIRTTPNFIVAENFRDIKGHVSNLLCGVGSESGFLQAVVSNSELSSIGATAAELDMIRQYMNDGIYLS